MPSPSLPPPCAAEGSECGHVSVASPNRHTHCVVPANSFGDGELRPALLLPRDSSKSACRDHTAQMDELRKRCATCRCTTFCLGKPAVADYHRRCRAWLLQPPSSDRRCAPPRTTALVSRRRGIGRSQGRRCVGPRVFVVAETGAPSAGPRLVLVPRRDLGTVVLVLANTRCDPSGTRDPLWCHQGPSRCSADDNSSAPYERISGPASCPSSRVSSPTDSEVGGGDCGCFATRATPRCACRSPAIKPVPSTSATPAGGAKREELNSGSALPHRRVRGITDTPSIVCTYTVPERGSIASGSEELLAWAISARLAPG